VRNDTPCEPRKEKIVLARRELSRKWKTSQKGPRGKKIDTGLRNSGGIVQDCRPRGNGEFYEVGEITGKERGNGALIYAGKHGTARGKGGAS